MVKLNIGQERQTEQPVITLNMAKLKLSDVEWFPQPEEIEKKDGSGTFINPPYVNCLTTIVDDYGDGTHDDQTFWEKFRLVLTKTAETAIKEDPERAAEIKLDAKSYEVRPGTKPGALMECRYEAKFWEGGIEFNPEDFEGWEFNAGLIPRKPPGGGNPTGTQVDYNGMHAIPTPKKKKKAKESEPSGSADSLADRELTDEDLAKMNEAMPSTS